LAGLGYCQELIFRTRTSEEDEVSEMRWDCRLLKHLLRSHEGGELRDIVLQAVSVRRLSANGVPAHFFEVELGKIVRHRNDQLLDVVALDAYLSQVAPVAFAPEFTFGGRIADVLRPYVKLGEVIVSLPGIERPVCRPYRDCIDLGPSRQDAWTDLETIAIPGMNGETAAIGWVLHHGYTGALPSQTLQKGLRLRIGDMQIGDERLLDEIFPEPRFNAWCVGEVHIIDPRVVPNGRRDGFEQNTHYLNILTHLTLVARNVAKRCRSSSVRRNRWREFHRHLEDAKEKLAIVRQNAIGRTATARLLRELQGAMAEAERLAQRDLFVPAESRRPERELQRLKRGVAQVTGANRESPLAHLSKPRREAYQEIISLIYDCAPNRVVAKAIVDRVIARL
jgi:molecular chaperone HtpG